MLKKAVKYALKARAHALKPVVLLGAKGLTEAVIAEIDTALLANELIKVRLTGVERDEKQAVVNTLCEALRAECVQLIGHVATVFRENPELTVVTPNITARASARREGAGLKHHNAGNQKRRSQSNQSKQRT